MLFLLVVASCLGQLPPQGSSLPSPVVCDLPVTNGLIRWWPNLFDAKDEISGQEGVIMGLLPPVATGAQDPTEFSRATGWVLLRPAITNEIFTLSFWIRCRGDVAEARLLGQESDQGQWLLQSFGGGYQYFIGPHHFDERHQAETVSLTPETWQHVAVCRKADGTSQVWADGVQRLNGRQAHLWPNKSDWLTVGNPLQGGDEPFHGQVRDLCVFSRLLDGPEIQSLHSAGLPDRVARNTAARQRATARAITVEVSTNLATTSNRHWTHKRFTTEDGLPGNVARAVLLTTNKYLWVGTEEGLARFDGRDFRAFTPENTPALQAVGKSVWSLAEDQNGTVWAGVFGGLIRIRGLEFTGFTNGLPQRFILQVAAAGGGALWVAGFNSFIPRGPCWLRRYHPESGATSAAVVVPGHIRRLVVATNGVWLATEQPQQIHFWDGASPAPVVIGTFDYPPLQTRLGSSGVLPASASLRAWQHSLDAKDSWAEIRLGVSGPAFYGLWDRRLQRPFVSRGDVFVRNETWLGTSYGLARLQDGSLDWLELPDSPTEPQIACLAGNLAGGVWFGTEEDGLHLLQERLVRVYTTRDGLTGNEVRSVSVAPDGDVWVATSGGVSRWQGGEWSGFSKDRMRTVAVDPHGRAWVGKALSGWGGVQMDLASNRTNYLYLGVDWQHPRSMRFSRDGTLWIACERGLTWIKADSVVPATNNLWIPNPKCPEPVWGRYSIGQELPDIWPVGILDDKEGSIWLGSRDDGLFRIRNWKSEAVALPEEWTGRYCVPVYRDNSEALWFVGDGCLVRHRDGRFQCITYKAGLPKDSLLDLIEDDLGYFWVSGKRGIHRLARRELEQYFTGSLERVHSLTLGVRDGLLTPECSSFHYPSMARTPDGDIWVATLDGLARFDPHRVRLNTRPITAVVEQVVVNRREAPFSDAGRDRLQLPAGSGQQLEFHFTAISLANADRLKFMYRLDGYDTEWSPATDRRLAFYTNLRPGTYQFRVKAGNEHGVWSDQDTTVKLEILPYFWQRGVFHAGVALGLVVIFTGVHSRRLVAQRRRQELQHRQMLTSEKDRIAADMHDELGGALTQIAILGEVAKSQIGDAAGTRSCLDLISQSARDLTTRLGDLVWATNPRHDTLDDLAAYLREHAAVHFESTPIRAQLEFPSTIPECHMSATFRRNLLLVLKEAVHNILKHSGATEARVQLLIQGPSLVLRIQDNGHGFEVSNVSGRGNGLGNMQRRVHDLNGEWHLESVLGHGTTLEVRLPLSNPSSK